MGIARRPCALVAVPYGAIGIVIARAAGDGGAPEKGARRAES